MKEKQFYTMQELADRWGLSYGAILANVTKGDILSFRVGKSVRIHAAEVERIERQGRRKAV